MRKKWHFCSRVIFILGLASALAACDVEKSSNPLSPSIASPIAGVSTSLTVGVPESVSPISGAVTDTNQATLVVNNAPVTGSASSVTYKFEVAKDAGFATIVVTITVAAGTETTSTTTDDLDWDTTYYWRAQAIGQGTEEQVIGSWSDGAAFKTASQPLLLGTPILVSPINGATAPANPPVFTVTNGSISGPVGPITLFFHIATDPSVSNVITVFEIPMSNTGTTSGSSATLPTDSLLYWRVFAGDGITVSTWTGAQSFRTPVPPTPTCCPPPNRFEVVQQVASETGYPDSGIDVTDFTQKVAERLAQEDANWGRRINITGPLGKDTVAYRVNGENDDPYSIDIVLGATGDNPSLHWSQHGHIGGTWTPAN